MDDPVVQHLIEIKAALATQGQKLDNVERAVLGNGQPGLAQKVEELEAHKNRANGALMVLTVVGTGIWGALEYLFHLRGSK